MRRVYDDSLYGEISFIIKHIIDGIDPMDVSEYDYGCYRAQVSKIKDVVLRELKTATGKNIKYGRNDHANGIGNDNAIEVIVESNNEEQICALLHITDDMYGGCICWVSDIDGKRTTSSRKINGVEPRSKTRYGY